ncbi:hypothetical protein [uncultured Polaribacter sp.]|uniref:hypothetical protein n=1 Tax=uncultured Polaribacter sp. TaxID=174711 RepID=UPI002625C860|nr:hypothetical protein [uncultured Polaribacter sp.]
MDKLNISIKNYLNPKGLRGFFLKIFYFFSDYTISVRGSLGSGVLLFINNEFSLRKDHYKQLERVYLSLLERGVDVVFVSATRRLTFFGKFNFKKQFEKVFLKIGSNYEKVLVFCDSVPLQNFLVSKYNTNKVPTYSLQHGFYIEDSNEVFLNVYKSSNAKNFFVWDKRTLQYMKKHNFDRNYILVGPHLEKEYSSNSISVKSKYQIAIYGCGKDQNEENDYLKKVYFFLKSKDIKTVIIPHPKWTIFDKIFFYFKNNIWLKSNKLKHCSFDLSLVLNSTVFNELKVRGEKYKILNSYFKSGIIPSVEQMFDADNERMDVLSPFSDVKESLSIIINSLKV